MDFEKFKPIEDRVLLRLETHEEHVTEGGIIIQESNEEVLSRRARRASVLSCGPTCKYVKSGDTVALRRYVGQAIKIEGLEYILLKEGEIEGILYTS